MDNPPYPVYSGEVRPFAQPIVLPVVVPPSSQLRVPYYHVTEDQLQLLEMHAAAHHWSFNLAGVSAGILATLAATLLVTKYSDATFPWVLGTTIAMIVTTAIFGTLALRGRRKASSLLQYIRRQHPSETL